MTAGCATTLNYNEFTANGSTTCFNITFGYHDAEDIRARLNGVELDNSTYAPTSGNPSQICFTTAPAAGTLRIYRCTDLDALSATFNAGSTIRAVDLNDNFEQLKYGVEDANNRILASQESVTVNLGYQSDGANNPGEVTCSAGTNAPIPIVNATTAGLMSGAMFTLLDGTWDIVTGGINYPGGNVGINTTSPAELLDIRGANLSSTFRGQQFHDGTSSRLKIGYQGGAPTSGLLSHQILADSSDLNICTRDNENGHLNFYTGSGVTRKMRLLGNGNLGIGEDTPTQLLHIKGAALSSTYVGQLLSDNTSERLRIGYLGGNPTTGLVSHQILADSNDLNICSRDTVNGTINFYTGAGVTRKMRLLGNGNLGLGTAAPSQLFNIQGAALSATYVGQLFSDSSVERLRIGYQSGNPTTGLVSHQIIADSNDLNLVTRDTVNGAINFYTGSGVTRKMRIMGNGNVGIGTDTPSQLLNLEGTGISTTFVGQLFNDSVERLRIGYQSGSPTTGLTCHQILSDSNNLNICTRDTVNGTVDFYTGSGVTRKMRIMGNGSVGIGVADPAGSLNIQSATAAAASLTYDTANILNLDYGTIQLAFGVNSASPFGGYLQARNNSNAAIPFSLNPLGGNVGIGTSNPTRDLVVNKSTANTWISVRSGDANIAGILLGDQTSDAPGQLAYSNSNNSLTVATNGTNQLIVNSNGQLLVGLASANTGVSGSIACNGRLQANGSYSNTTGSAENLHIANTGIISRSTSSIRFKTNVETMQDKYADAVLNARPVWFNSTATDDQEHPDWGYWGFIAEEIADIDPRLVQFSENEDGSLQPEGVQYSRFVPHLINLVKRLHDRITVLESN